MKAAPRKSRKTFSLSRDTLAYLESYRVRGKAPSLSGVVEVIVREQKEREEAEKIAAETRQYYDTVGSAELEESEIWGKFAEYEAADSET
jgi:hypothetical protein